MSFLSSRIWVYRSRRAIATWNWDTRTKLSLRDNRLFSTTENRIDTRRGQDSILYKYNCLLYTKLETRQTMTSESTKKKLKNK